MKDTEYQVVHERQRLRLLRASVTPGKEMQLDALTDLAHRAHVEMDKARIFSKELVKIGYWAKTGRAEETRYAITPNGRTHAATQARRAG